MKEVEKFEVGEVVAIKGWGYNATYRVKKIARETATQYVIDNDLRFRKSDLHQIGDTYCRLYKLTQEIRDEITFEGAKRKITSLMGDIGNNRNHIKTQSIENIKKAQELMEEAVTLLGIKI